MSRILEEGLETALCAKELILSPHRDPELIIAFLQKHLFVIVHDAQIVDKKKSYRVIKGISVSHFK